MPSRRLAIGRRSPSAGRRSRTRLRTARSPCGSRAGSRRHGRGDAVAGALLAPERCHATGDLLAMDRAFDRDHSADDLRQRVQGRIRDRGLARDAEIRLLIGEHPGREVAVRRTRRAAPCGRSCRRPDWYSPALPHRSSGSSCSSASRRASSIASTSFRSCSSGRWNQSVLQIRWIRQPRSLRTLSRRRSRSRAERAE